MRSCFVLALLSMCVGCADFGLRGADLEVPCDAGLGDAELAALDGGVILDAGFCAPPEVSGDNDPLNNPVPPADCAPLLVATCGPLNECAEDPGCTAATLLERFEPESCAAAEGNARSFPPCTEGACDRLVRKVCGDADACADAPSCTPSQTLQTRSDDGDVSAEASCGSALSDESLFPPCGT
ncbi:MAG: hypothetical protein Q8O67_18185 [Deltaproteobacteria bacterium]|nr:hypothetical protein [Deltaproteobacteria bacterium]